MNDSIHALAAIYRQSSPAKSGALKDYTLDWEKFLRAAGLHDGDAREQAERELLAAERISGGMMVIDRHPRTGAKQVIRLKRDGGEAWLFAAVGESSPTEERESTSVRCSGAGSRRCELTCSTSRSISTHPSASRVSPSASGR